MVSEAEYQRLVAEAQRDTVAFMRARNITAGGGGVSGVLRDSDTGATVNYVINDPNNHNGAATITSLNGDRSITQTDLDNFKRSNPELFALLDATDITVRVVPEGGGQAVLRTL